MRLLTFIAFMREIRKADPDLERIQSMGLLAVKIGQILALRSDLLTGDMPETPESVPSGHTDTTRGLAVIDSCPCTPCLP